MSRISDFKSAPMEVLSSSTDSSLATLTGARFQLADGREVVLVQNAGTALVAGNLIQGPAQVANHQNIAVTAFSAATTNALATATVTLGATAATANQYQGGQLVVNAGTGIGQTLKVSGHPAALASGSLVVTLEDNPAVALDATSKVCLRLNPHGSSNGTDVRTDGVIICPTTLTGQVVGVSLTAVPASTSTVPSFGFIQTRGPVACLNNGGTAIGLDLMPSGTAAGACATFVATTSTRIGTAVEAGVTTEARQIVVQL